VRRLSDLQERAREIVSPDTSYTDDEVETMISSMRTHIAHRAGSLSDPAKQLGRDADKMQEAASDMHAMVEQVQDLAKGAGKKFQARLTSMVRSLEDFARRFDEESKGAHKAADALESAATDIGTAVKGF
jgi:uncharacterized protein YukE